MVSITIQARNANDPVIDAIADALSNTIDEAFIEKPRFDSELRNFNRVLGKAKVKSLRTILFDNYGVVDHTG